MLMSDLIKHVRLFDGCTILDAGAGRMDLLAFLQDQVHVEQYIAVDFSEDLLKIGQSRFPRATAIVGDIRKIEFSGTVDFVFSSGLLPYAKVAQREEYWVYECIAKMFRLCRVACAFNFNSRLKRSVHRQSDSSERWHLSNVVELLEFCLSMTDRVIVDHSQRHEFATITLMR
jgi:ubiquinone/menaquinone biosynthesis C-methylase UbiE